MVKSYQVPEFTEVVSSLLPLELVFEGDAYTIDEWRKKNLLDVVENRKRTGIRAFNLFVSGLLERYGTRGAYRENHRRNLMDENIHSLDDVTQEMMEWILRQNHYYLIDTATEVALGVKELFVKNPDFAWEEYFDKAEKFYESGYKEDEILNIKGVGKSSRFSKTRDYAISQFSTYYCAIDQNLARVICRTGLIVHGYGLEGYGTSPTENYEFLQKLIIRFSKETGWAPDLARGYSPKEIDAMLWFFGSENGRCKARPQCSSCPLNVMCLTFQNRGVYV